MLQGGTRDSEEIPHGLSLIGGGWREEEGVGQKAFCVLGFFCVICKLFSVDEI